MGTSVDETALVVLCTVPDLDVGKTLSAGLVDAGLAACVNLVPSIRSFYQWKGKVEDEQECLLVIKTTRGRYPALEAWLRDHHPYEVPEILAIGVTAGSADYLAWVAASTSG